MTAPRYYVATGFNWWDVWERLPSGVHTRRLVERFHPSDNNGWAGAQNAATACAARLNGSAAP